MSVPPEELRVGETVLEEGDKLTRLKFRPFDSDMLKQSPTKVKEEAATDIFHSVGDDVEFNSEEKLFQALQEDSAETLERISNQLESIGRLESEISMPMRVKQILKSNSLSDSDEIILKDLGTDSTITVDSETLATHIGETIFTTD